MVGIWTVVNNPQQAETTQKCTFSVEPLAAHHGLNIRVVGFGHFQ
jgi:hypothetical protein